MLRFVEITGYANDKEITKQQQQQRPEAAAAVELPQDGLAAAPLSSPLDGSGSAELPTSTALAVPSPTLSTTHAGGGGGGAVDLARSLGWRSVSTAGDEEDEQKEGEYASSGVGPEDTAGADSNERMKSSSASLTAAASAAGASAALSACVAIGGSDGRREVPAREALLGVLGRLFQQCSVYLEPCRGDPLVESRPPPRGGRPETRVQLQLVRREERALKTVVQPEVRIVVVVVV